MSVVISYSSDDGRVSRKDIDETSRISEEYFGTELDASQLSTEMETRNWIYRHASDYLNIIRADGVIIGYAFLLPSHREMMDDFLSKRISEAALFDRVKKTSWKGIPDALYLCASVVEKNYQRRGLATEAFCKAIRKITHDGEKKPLLFYWRYSDAGGRVAEKVARVLGFDAPLFVE